MKKYLISSTLIVLLLVITGFTYFGDGKKEFDLDDLYDYQKEFETEELSVCSENTAKTYMDYRMTTVVSSRQYQFLRNECTVDKKTGFLYDEEGFIAVALGSFYGVIGDRYYFTLDSGVVLPLVKGEEKADEDTDYSGCYHVNDGSVIEFVIDDEYAAAYFGANGNGYVLDGNYNNYPLFNGRIVRVEKAVEKKNRPEVKYEIRPPVYTDNDIFNYASGY